MRPVVSCLGVNDDVGWNVRYCSSRIGGKGVLLTIFGGKWWSKGAGPQRCDGNGNLPKNERVVVPGC